MTSAMKKFFRFIIFFALAAMTFSACNKTEIENPQNEEDFYYTFTLTSPTTKSILSSDENGKFGAWEDGDRLGTAIDEANPGYAYVTVGSPATFRIYKQGGLNGGEIVYAYYPYNSSAASVAEIPMVIPADQNQSGTTFDFDAMPMVAEGFEVPVSYASENNNTEVGEISLVNLGSVIAFQVYSSDATYAEETILSVKFAASGAIAGGFTKDITEVSFTDESSFAISGFTGVEVTTTVADAPAIGATRNDAANIYMVVAPTSGITGSVVVTTNKAVYTYDMATAQTFKRAGLKSFGLNLGTCQNRVAEETAIPVTVSSTISEILESMGKADVEAGTAVKPLIVDDVITMTTTGAGNNAKVYGTSPSQDWRIYAQNNGNVIISAKGGYKLKSVKLTYTKQSSPTFNGPESGARQEVSEASVEYGFTGTTGHIRISAVEVQYVQIIVSSIAISGQKTEFFVGDEFTFGGTVTATYVDGTTEDVTAGTTFSEVDLSTEGTKEVTVSYGGKTATYEITVTARPTPTPSGFGTWAAPYNAAAAMEIIETLADNTTTDDMVYVTGTIVGTPSFNATFGNMQYEITSGNVVLTVYRGFYFNGAKFTSADQLKEGDVVTVYGKLKKYVNSSDEVTAEVDQDNILVELNGAKHMIAPTVSTEVNNDAKTIKVSWTAVDGATSYDVTCGNQTQTGLTSTTYTFTVTEDGTYNITVSAKASGLETVTGEAVAIIGSADWASIETSNVTLSAGTNGSTATVNGYNAIKVGTSSKGGDMSVTVPAGTTKLHVHAAAWKGVTGLSLNISGATVAPASIALTADDGIANNSPFILSGDAEDFYFEIALSDITSETAITFTSGSAKRFVVWGVNAE